MKLAIYDSQFHELVGTLQATSANQVVAEPFAGTRRNAEANASRLVPLARGSPRLSSDDYLRFLLSRLRGQAVQVPDDQALEDTWPGFDNDPDGTFCQQHPGCRQGQAQESS